MSAQSVQSTFPIDAVITWVDGGDPLHSAKLQAYLSTLGGPRPRAASSARFHSSGEIDYCVTSLLRFAPWLNTIYIVTDAQQPALMQQIKGTAFEQRIKIIDHRDIFTGFEQHLPTFNSSSILSVLWRIPGLSEHFLFLNDDFCLIRPVLPEDFYRDGKVVLRGSWSRFAGESWYKRIINAAAKIFKKNSKVKKRVGWLASQELTARLLGFSGRYFRVPHNPHAWRVSTQAQYFKQHPDLLAFNVSFRLRSDQQFISDALAPHLELQKNAALIDNSLSTLQLKPADQSLARVKRKIEIADKQSRYAFVCVQNFEQSSAQHQELIVNWLNHRVGLLSDCIKEKNG